MDTAHKSRVQNFRHTYHRKYVHLKTLKEKLSKECYIIKSFKETTSAQTISSTNFC